MGLWAYMGYVYECMSVVGWARCCIMSWLATPPPSPLMSSPLLQLPQLTTLPTATTITTTATTTTAINTSQTDTAATRLVLRPNSERRSACGYGNQSRPRPEREHQPWTKFNQAPSITVALAQVLSVSGTGSGLGSGHMVCRTPLDMRQHVSKRAKISGLG